MAVENGGSPASPFAGDITGPEKKRERSEPASLHAAARAVLMGPSHHQHEGPPVKTIASASLMQVGAGRGRGCWPAAAGCAGQVAGSARAGPAAANWRPLQPALAAAQPLS